MKKSIKQIHFWFFALSLTLILVDGSFIDFAFSPDQEGIYKECSDVSKHFEYSHSVCSEDDVFINHLIVKSNLALNCIETPPDLTVIIKSNHITYIWQPPKIS